MLKDTPLEKVLVMAGSDTTSAMSGKHKGAIRHLELQLGRPLQWNMCLLHLNELPIRHIFTTLDGTTKSPDSFSGPIGKQLNGDVSDWKVVRFKSIPNRDFQVIPEDVVADLSNNQYNSYRLCNAVISGRVDSELARLEIGPLFHSRWLTFGARILRFYTSVRKP